MAATPALMNNEIHSNPLLKDLAPKLPLRKISPSPENIRDAIDWNGHDPSAPIVPNRKCPTKTSEFLFFASWSDTVQQTIKSNCTASSDDQADESAFEIPRDAKLDKLCPSRCDKYLADLFYAHLNGEAFDMSTYSQNLKYNDCLEGETTKSSHDDADDDEYIYSSFADLTLRTSSFRDNSYVGCCFDSKMVSFNDIESDRRKALVRSPIGKGITTLVPLIKKGYRRGPKRGPSSSKGAANQEGKKSNKHARFSCSPVREEGKRTVLQEQEIGPWDTPKQEMKETIHVPIEALPCCPSLSPAPQCHSAMISSSKGSNNFGTNSNHTKNGCKGPFFNDSLEIHLVDEDCDNSVISEISMAEFDLDN